MSSGTFDPRALHRNRDDLVVEHARRPRIARETLRSQCIRVHDLARQGVAFGEVLRRLGHRASRDGVAEGFRERVDEGRIDAESNAIANSTGDEGRLRHRFSAADQAHLGLAGANRGCALHDGLESRAAQPVHGERGRLDATSGTKRNVSREVAGVRRRLKDVAEKHLVDGVRRDARPLRWPRAPHAPRGRSRSGP